MDLLPTSIHYGGLMEQTEMCVSKKIYYGIKHINSS